jgi:hypothetical protein
MLPTMAKSMPWLMSMFMHVGLALIFMFVVMIATPEAPDITGFDVNFDPSLVNLPPINDTSSPDPNPLKPKERMPRGGRRMAGARPQMQLENAETNVVGPSDMLTGLESHNVPTRLAEARSDTSIFGELGVDQGGTDGKGGGPGGPGGGGGGGGGDCDVVYLIDRSGSMIDTFDRVRQEMLLSIAKLKPSVRFHVVLFAEGRPLEKYPRRMTPASQRAKDDLVVYLKPVRPYGKTDPIPAINRAFDVLPSGSAKRATTIYLLTDGVFPDNRAVMDTIRRQSIGRRIRINTILYGNRPPMAERVLKRIAADTGGKYKFISSDE